MAMETANRMEGILVATSASEKAGRVGMGGIVRDTLGNTPGEVVARYSITIGSRDDQNVYTAELEAIAMALRCMPDGLQHRELTVMTSSRSALEVVAQPRQQSGQCTVKEIHKHAERLQKSGNIVKMQRCGRRLSSPWTRGDLMQTRLDNILTNQISGQTWRY
ncbi:reverse transcriptase [Ilyonectria robusta]